MPSQQINNKVQRRITEYFLPATVQSHEIVAPVGRSDLLLASQQECNSIIKLKLGSLGNIISATKSAIRGNRYSGLHGLHASKLHPGQVWLTLQFSNELLRIDPDSLQIQSQLHLPHPLTGPHAVMEDGEYLWVACKHSNHVARVNPARPTEKPLVHQCSQRPIMVAKTKTHVYASLDQSSRIFCLDLSTGKHRELHINASRGSTPVGLVSQPDGNAVWFVLLGALGIFGCISGEKISYYQLTIPMASTAGLIHLAFDEEYAVLNQPNVKLWLLASSLAVAGGGHNHHGAKGGPPEGIVAIDALVTVIMEPSTIKCGCGDGCKCDPCDCANPMRIVSEEIVFLPTQKCLAHRVLWHAPSGSAFVTELGAATVAQVTGSVLLGSDDKRTDSSALWGHGVADDQVDFVPEGLVGWWIMDESSGKTVRDSSPTMVTGTITGSATWNQGLVFNGATMVSLGTKPSLGGKTSFSISVWVKTTSSSPTKSVLVQQRSKANKVTDGFNGEYQLYLRGGEKPTFWVFGDGASQFDLATTTVVNDGNWHHIIAIRDGSEGRIFIDGKLSASASNPVKNLNANIPVFIGSDARHDHEFFTGTMRDVRIYKRALTGDEISYLSARSSW